MRTTKHSEICRIKKHFWGAEGYNTDPKWTNPKQTEVCGKLTLWVNFGVALWVIGLGITGLLTRLYLLWCYDTREQPARSLRNHLNVFPAEKPWQTAVDSFHCFWTAADHSTPCSAWLLNKLSTAADEAVLHLLQVLDRVPRAHLWSPENDTSTVAVQSASWSLNEFSK